MLRTNVYYALCLSSNKNDDDLKNENSNNCSHTFFREPSKSLPFFHNKQKQFLCFISKPSWLERLFLTLRQARCAARTDLLYASKLYLTLLLWLSLSLFLCVSFSHSTTLSPSFSLSLTESLPLCWHFFLSLFRSFFPLSIFRSVATSRSLPSRQKASPFLQGKYICT